MRAFLLFLLVAATFSLPAQTLAETLGYPAGISVLLIHTALDGAESEGMAGGVEGWGNRWRQQDYNFFTSDSFINLLKAHNIQLTTWREVAQKWQHLKR